MKGNAKFYSFFRAQEEIRKANDFRRRLLERNQNAALKNEEKLLAKKVYTYNYAGDIIFVQKPNWDGLPSTLLQPKMDTKLKPISSIPEGSIHKVQNENWSQEEYVDKLF